MVKIKLSRNALIVLKKRYLKKNSQGKIIETPTQLFQRVAKNIALTDAKYLHKKQIQALKNKARLPFWQLTKTKQFQKLIKNSSQIKKTQKQFYQLLTNLDFLPNSPALFNAGRKIQQLSACFVLPLEDNLNSIFLTLHKAALIHQSGGGTGFSFSSLRPKDDSIRNTDGTASGPLSFLRIYDAATEQIKQGGKRRGANMGILNINHPDIKEFITAKQNYPLKNFNLSVAITDKFIKAVKQNKKINLINPRNKKTVSQVKANELFGLICQSAWQTGDPGIIFIDTINKFNPTPKQKIEATNPCAEVPLLPYESCNLGSINLANHIKDNQIDWLKLKNTIHSAVHFLDNCIDLSNYIFPEINRTTKQNRKIGLGVMGFADFLTQLNISYNSEQALKIVEEIMKFIHQEAKLTSQQFAKIRGPFPNFKNSSLKQKQRNATLTSIAPTGSISLIAGCSSSIEPLFALAFTRHILTDQHIIEINKHLIKTLKRNKLYTESTINKILKTGTLKNIKEIPKDIKEIFLTALEVPPEQHLKIQAIFQKYTDNAVSKTINLPKTTPINQIKKIFLQAHQLGCKGLTIYRYGSKPEQVLTLGLPKEKQKCLTCQ